MSVYVCIPIESDFADESLGLVKQMSLIIKDGVFMCFVAHASESLLSESLTVCCICKGYITTGASTGASAICGSKL